jgi:hypothetical protein
VRCTLAPSSLPESIKTEPINNPERPLKIGAEKQSSFQRFALEMVMEHFAELMQRLLEIQSGGRQRSPELIAEDINRQQSLLEKSGEDCHAGAGLTKLDRLLIATCVLLLVLLAILGYSPARFP